MIDPRSLALSSGTALRTTSKDPLRLTLTTAAQAFGSYSSTGAVGPAMPALLTRQSNPPRLDCTSAIIASTSSGELTSPTDAVKPGLSATAASTAWASMSAMWTLLPSAANARAMTRPIPPAPAVTSTRCAMA